LIAALAFCAVARALTEASQAGALRPIVTGLGAIGQAAMAIFVAHVIFTAGVRAALLGYGIGDIGVHALAGTGAGVAGPMLMLWVARRLRIAGLLGL
jgi:hypothetical protein